MKNRITFSFAIFFVWIISAFAISGGAALFSGSIKHRYCTVLPLISNLESGWKNELRELIGSQINSKTNCHYLDSKKLYGVFEQYDEKALEGHLKNPAVINVISRKLGAGSIFRVVVKRKNTTTDVKFEVIAEDGRTITFQKSTELSTTELSEIKVILSHWVYAFGKTVLGNYDARVIDVTDDRVILDIGDKFLVSPEHTFTVVRKLPFTLNKETLKKSLTKISTGKIYKVSKKHSYGIIEYNRYKSLKVKVGDWVQIDQLGTLDYEDDQMFERHNPHNLRNVGRLGFDVRVAQLTSKQDDVDGAVLGIGTDLEFFLPRNFFSLFRFSSELLNLSGSDQNISNSSFNLADNNLTLALGYSFTPTNLTVIDLYAGFAKSTSDLSTVNTPGFGKTTLKGLIVGVKTEIPIYQKLHFSGDAFFSLLPSFSSDDVKFGDGESVQFMQFKVGGLYRMSQRWSINTHYIYARKTAESVNIVNGKLAITENLITVGGACSF